MQNEAVITIKLSDSELSLLINSLGMLESTIVPCVDNGKWNKLYCLYLNMRKREV